MKNEEIKNYKNPVDLVQLIDALDMQSDHLSYQKDRLREIAVEWCHQNKLAYK